VLGLGEVGLVEASGAAVFAVPGVGELVGEEIGLGELAVGAGVVALADAVVGGLAVLKALAAGDVREREQKVVGVVVVRAVHRGGFANEVGDLGEELGAEVRVFGAVGDDVEVVGGLDLGCEGKFVEVLAGDDGGVFELLDGGGCVGDLCGLRGADGRERGADAPSGGDDDGGLDRNVADGQTGGVEQKLFPLENGELLADAGGGDTVEVRVQHGDTGGDGEMEGVHVDFIATPREGFAVGGEDDTGDVRDRTGGAVVAGDPLRRGEGERAGADGDVDVGVVDFARCVAEVGGDLDGLLHPSARARRGPRLLGAEGGGEQEQGEREDGLAEHGAYGNSYPP